MDSFEQQYHRETAREAQNRKEAAALEEQRKRQREAAEAQRRTQQEKEWEEFDAEQARNSDQLKRDLQSGAVKQDILTL